MVPGLELIFALLVGAVLGAGLTWLAFKYGPKLPAVIAERFEAFWSLNKTVILSMMDGKITEEEAKAIVKALLDFFYPTQGGKHGKS